MEDLTIRSPGVSRRHLVAGAVGAMALPIASSAFGRGIEAPATEADERFMRGGLRGLDRRARTKIGQIMITDAEIADKTPFADIAITGGVLAHEAMQLFK